MFVGVPIERTAMTEHAHDRPPPLRRRSLALPALLLFATLAACTGDTPLQPDRAATPGAPSMLLNPLCAGSGGTTHASATLTSAEHWYASGNPHRVTGSQVISTGGSLRIHPGVLVCFSPGTELWAKDGGHVAVDGADTAQVVLTATDPAFGWYGIYLQGTPGATSFVAHARVELVNVGAAAVTSTQRHEVVLDHVVIRQTGRGVVLHAPQSRIIDSRVDTTTSSTSAAVTLYDSTRFIRTTVRGAALAGVLVAGRSGVQLLGGRIEGSGDTGLYVGYSGAVASFQPIRVTGGSTYGAVMPVDAVARGYGSVAEMDSLLGNARDTLHVLGGTLTAPVFPAAALPWLVRGPIVVDAGGSLRPEPGARLAFRPTADVTVRGGGRLLARGTQAAPVVFTADDRAAGWRGIDLENTPASISFVTNARLEHVNVWYTALRTDTSHAVVIDSTVFRHVGQAASLRAYGSRLSRSRVDTTLNAYFPAVELSSNARLESTLVRGASGEGIDVRAATVQLLSCEVRESVGNGIVVTGLWATAEIRNCNLVDNGGVGVALNGTLSADAEDNWWGDAAGPTGAGGDGVAAGVDHTPWLTAPYTLPYVP